VRNDVRLESLTYDSSKYPATFSQHFIDKSLTRHSRNQISFKAENHERNEKHERRDHHSFNGKPQATASTGLLYFEGAEPRINVNFHELFFSHRICSFFPFLCVAASLREFSFFSQKAGRVPLPLFGSVSTNRES